MTDPLTVGIGVAAVAFILGLVFYFIASRDNFENWYSQQRKLEEEEKKKNKKPSKPKAKKNDSQKESQPKAEKRESVSTGKKEEKHDEEVEGKGKNKKNKKRDSTSGESKVDSTPSPEAKKPEKKAEKAKEQSVRERSPLKNKNGSEGFTEVKNKAKRSPEKNGEQLPEKTATETPKEEKIPVQKVKDTQKAAEPKKRKFDDMDIGKLLMDMAGGNVDQVHVQYLRTYVENVNKKEKAASAAIQEKNDLLKQIQTQTGKIRSLEEIIAHHQTEKSGLTDHLNQLTLKEKQLAAEVQKRTAATLADVDIIKKAQQQIITLNKELETAKELAKRHEHAVSEVADLKRDLAAGAEQITSLVTKVSLMESRASDTQQLEGANSEIAALKQKILGLEQQLDESKQVVIESTEVTQLKQKVKDLQDKLAEAEKIKDALDSLQEKWNTLKASLAEKENQPKAVDYEDQIEALQREIENHKESNVEWAQKHSKLMDEYLAMKALVEKIQGEVQNFEEMQRNVAEKQALVDKQKEEIAKFLKEQDSLHAETLNLHKQISDLKKQLASRQSNGDLGEEVMIQKAAPTLAAAPISASPSADVRKLVEENKYLQQKNDELRDRNFQLSEMIQNQPVQSSSNNTETKVETVVHEIKESKKKDKRANKKNDTPAPTHAPVPVKDNADEDNTKIKTYRDALIAVKDELSRISELAEQRRERIADLEARLNNSDWPKLHQLPTKVAPSSAKASPSVAAATATAKATAKSPKKAPSGSEGGEEDWELVE